MPKRQFQQCNNCGRVTDLDEQDCPVRCVINNPEPKLKTVELDQPEINELIRKKLFWTKRQGDFGK